MAAVIIVAGSGVGSAGCKGAHGTSVIIVAGSGVGSAGKSGAHGNSMTLKSKTYAMPKMSKCVATTYLNGRIVVPSSG